MFVVAVVGLFVACRYYVGHPNDTPAFVAGVIGLLTLAAIVAQAVIYKRQSDLMRHALERTDSIIEQNERYAVVEKFGAGGPAAMKLDPRARRMKAKA